VSFVGTTYSSVRVLSTPRAFGMERASAATLTEPRLGWPRSSLMGLFRDPLVLLLIAAAAAIAFFLVAMSV
jgi:hypothetical protein